MYCISKEITGINKDLIFDNDIKLINRERNEDDILICEKDNKSSISYYAKQVDIDLSLEIPIKYNNMWKFLDHKPDWSHIIGVERFVKMCVKLVKKTDKFVNNDDYSYYTGLSMSNTAFVNETCSAKVDDKNLLTYLNGIEPFRAKKIIEVVNIKEKMFKKINYSLFNTTTGRMTVDSGLNILNLDKKHRNIMKSSFIGGKILEIDIKNLEPRILMGLTKDEVPNDIYMWIKDNILNDMQISRSQIKVLIFKIIYGASMATIKYDLKDVYNAEDIIYRVKTALGYQKFALQIRHSVDDNGFFRNHYGRLLKKSSADVNHFLQSTGVDVSLLCFKKVNDILTKANISYKVIGFIHDAMIIDVSEKSCKFVIKNLNEKNINVEGFKNGFPIVITEVR